MADWAGLWLETRELNFKICYRDCAKYSVLNSSNTRNAQCSLLYGLQYKEEDQV